MKESELKVHERHALSIYRQVEKSAPRFTTISAESLYQFGKEIAEKLEPELKPVDMSMLIGSGVDCAFSDDLRDLDTEEAFAFLGKVNQESMRFLTTENYPFNYCKPRMNYWFSADNFDDVDDLLTRLNKAGFEIILKSTADGIVSFMIKDKKADRCWPWEVE